MAHLNPSFSSSSSSSSSNTASTSSTRFSRQPPSPFLPDSTWNTHGLLPYTGSSGFTYPDSFPSSHESNNGSHFGNNHFFEKSSPQNTLPTSLTPTLSTFHPMSQHHDVFHNTSFQTYEPGRSPLQNTIPHSSPSPTIPQLLPVSSSHPPSSSSSLSLSSVFPSSSSTSSSLPLKPMTLEEVEQQLFLQHHHSRPSSATGSRSTSIQPSPTSSYISSPLSYSTSTSTHSFTLEEVEKLIIHHHHQHHPHPHPTYALATNDMDQLVEIRKSAREANMRRLSKYNGIMSRYERDQVTRIHISQLVTDNPMVDDFYYQIYTTMRGGPSTMDAIRYKPPLLQRGVRNASLQEQVERILENAKLKPKATQFSLEGALGKIALTSSKKPRQSLQVSSKSLSSTSSSSTTSSPSSFSSATPTTMNTIPTSSSSSSLSSTFSSNGSPTLPPPHTTPFTDSSTPHPTSPSSPSLPSPSKFSIHSMLLVTENLYLKVIDLEQWKRDQATFMSHPTPTSSSLISDPSDFSSSLASSSSFPSMSSSHLHDEVSQVQWNVLESLDTKIHEATLDLWNALNETQGDIPMTVVLLSCNKGKKVWPRVLRLLDSSSTLTLVSHLFTHFHQVDVIKNASIPALYASPSLFPGADASKPTFSQLLQFIESTETFMLYVLPTLVDTLANASWPVIYQCWQWLFDQTDVIGLGSSRVGLSVITLLVSRSEMLFNQVVADQGPHPPPLALPPQAWQQQVFPLLFETLQSHFLTLFPIHHFISLSKKSPDLESYLTDDTHVWQFLTSLVLAANVDQQQALVVEIKERILGNIAAGRGSNVDEKGKRKFNNVSFFLNALGLEANDLL